MQKNWWDKFPDGEPQQPQQPGMQVFGAPDPVKQGQVTIQGQTIQKNAADIANLPEQARIADANARKAEADARIAAANAASAGQVKAAELNQADEYKQRRANVEAATQQLQTVLGLYNSDFKGGGPLQSIRESLPEWLNPANSEFNTAGAGLSDVALAVTKVPGVGAQSDPDAARFVKANQPQASDFDSTIEQKLGNIRTRLDTQRQALGLPPIDWDAQVAAPGEAIDKTRQNAMSAAESQGAALSKDGMQTVEDPILRAVANQVGKMVAAGRSDAEIKAFMQKAGVNPDDTSIDQALQFRLTPQYKAWKQQNPKKPYPIGKSFYQKQTPITGLPGAMNDLGNVSPALTAGGGAYVNALTGNYLDNLSGNPEAVRAGLDLYGQEHPVASTVGDIAGQVTLEAGLGLVPGGQALAATRWGRRGLDAAYGAYAGSGANDEDRFSGALWGAPGNAAAGMVGRGAQRGVGSAFTGIKDESLKYLNDKGIDLTIGQIARDSKNPLGRMAAWTEDRLAGLPGTDATINSARYRGAQSFNEAALTDAAGRPVTATGEAGSEQLSDAVSEAYKKALGGVTLAKDKPFSQQWNGLTARGSRTPRYGDDFKAVVDDVNALFDQNGQLSGDKFQEAIQIIRKTDAEFAGQPGYSRLSKELDHLENALTSMAERQRPDVMPALREANKLNRNKKIVQRAMRSRVSQRNDGLISPTELNQQSIMNTERFGGADAAMSTNRPFYDLTKNAMNVMPGEIPDSGTSGRNMIVPLLGASLAAGGQGVSSLSGNDTVDQAGGIGQNLGLLALASTIPYSKAGQRAIQKGLLGGRPEVVEKFGQLLKDYPNLTGLLSQEAFRQNFLGGEVY